MKYLISLLICFKAFAGAGTFPQGDHVKLLKDILEFKTGITIGKGSVNPMVTATPADAGSILLANGKIYLKEDAGMTTNWHQIDLPDQTSQSGKYLKTNGIVSSWNEVNNDVNDIKNNLLNCASFEGCSPEGVITLGSGFDVSGTTTRTVEASAYNTTKLNVVGTATDTISYKVTKSVNFEDQQMYAYCEIKTTKPLTVFRVYSDSNLQASLDVSSDDKWKYYKIPFVGGATSQEFEIYSSDTTSASGIDIDNCYIGKAHPDLIQEVSEAHFVGSLVYYASSCTWSTTVWGLPPVNASCNASSIEGNILAPSTKIPAVSFQARTDGYYKVTWQGLLYKSTTDGACSFSLSSSNGYDNQGVAYAEGANGRSVNNLVGNFRFNSTGLKTITTMGYRESGSGSCFIYGDLGHPSKMSVYFYPDDKSTIVTQDTELTAKTANDFDIKVRNNGSSCAVASDVYEIVQSITRTSAGYCTITLKSGILTDTDYTCLGDSDNDATAQTTCYIASTTEIRGYTRENTTPYDRDFSIKITKSKAQYNKHATIVGKFENINSSELSKFRGAGNSGQAVSSSIDMPFTEINDKNSNWDGDSFLATNAGDYLVCGSANFTTSSNTVINAYVNGTLRKALSFYGSSKAEHPFCGVVNLQSGESLSVRPANALTLLNSAQYHHLYILQWSDFESVVANISKQKTKCQTKLLTANVVSNGTFLSFSNLSIGKYYELTGNLVQASTAVTVVKYGATEVGYYENSSGGNISQSVVIDMIKPTSSTLEISRNSGGTIFGSASRNRTNFTLCELPDTVIETTEFN